MIEIQNLTKHYGRIKAVDDLNFTVKKGEILGFLGPNGAGKSTTMNMITGYLPSTSGTVKVGGYDISQEPKEVKKRIGYLPEHPPLYMDMTIKEYLGFVCELKKVEKKQRKSQIDDIMELLRISDVKGRLIKNLSKGYKQRDGFAQSLVGNPEVLILDVPTVGLDPTQIIEVRKLIKALAKEHTIIFSSHIMQEVSAVCERVIIISKGKIVAIDTPENLSKSMGETARISIRIAGPKSSVLDVLQSVNGVKSVQVKTKVNDEEFDYVVDSDKEEDVRRPIFFELAKQQYPILELNSMNMSLEDIFLQLTSKEQKDISQKKKALEIEQDSEAEDNEISGEDQETEDQDTSDQEISSEEKEAE